MTRGREGLTIVETLIAIAVIGVVFVLLASLQVSNLGITRAASEDSQLLQDAVTEFERLRTVVLDDFESYSLGCPDGCDRDLEGTTGMGFDYVITRVWPDPDTPEDEVGRLLTAPPDSETPPVDGLLRITVTATRGDRTLEFAQYASCLDSASAPTIVAPGVCREP
jgi:type II secretory pathway pseudopilin PulG